VSWQKSYSPISEKANMKQIRVAAAVRRLARPALKTFKRKGIAQKPDRAIWGTELEHAVIANCKKNQRAHHDHGDDWVVQHEAEKWLEHVVKYIVNKPTHTVSPILSRRPTLLITNAAFSEKRI